MPYNPNNVPDAPLPISMLPDAEPLTLDDLLLVTQPNNSTAKSRRLKVSNLMARQLLFRRRATQQVNLGNPFLLGSFTLPKGYLITGAWTNVYFNARTGTPAADSRDVWFSLKFVDATDEENTLAKADFKRQFTGRPVYVSYEDCVSYIYPMGVTGTTASSSSVERTINVYLTGSRDANVYGWDFSEGFSLELIFTPAIKLPDIITG